MPDNDDDPLAWEAEGWDATEEAIRNVTNWERLLEMCRELAAKHAPEAEERGLSKCEFAQILRMIADILEHEELYTDPPLATSDPERSAQRASDAFITASQIELRQLRAQVLEQANEIARLRGRR